MASGKTGQSISAREIFEIVQEDLRRVEEFIRQESVASVDAITAIGHYLQTSGGKRLRPILVLLCAKLAGNSSPASIRMAAVAEMIHAATLVHDDVIDIAETRRGRPSTNIVWGNHTSVLAGDWLYMQAFQIALRERDFGILELLINLTQMMVEGELLQLGRIGRIDLTEADCMELVDRKTAGLFSACARLGAMSAGAPAEMVARLGEYGWNLGIAFQLVDDVLDFVSDESTLGKPVGNDLREGKVTLPLVYALEAAEPAGRVLVETVLEDSGYQRVPFAAILELVRNAQGIQRTLDRAQAFSEAARSIISEFADSPYQRALCSLPDLVTERDH